MAKYVYTFAEGNKDMKDLLGGKGANLAEMTNLGLPVPSGFTITTDACRAYLKHNEVPESLVPEVTKALRGVEDQIGRTLGDKDEPLLVSVRSGAKFSMPGMMETVLNVGLNDESVHGLAKMSGSDRFAWDSYRRLVQMFGKTVLDIDGDLFADALDSMKEKVGARADVDLTAENLQDLTAQFKQIVKEQTGNDFPQDPRTQMDMAIEAVFRSWNTERAAIYRRRERIPNSLGTAVNICTMVFGNMGDDSGTGVAFTRDPSTGKSGVYGDFLMNAQGEDVVAGIRNTEPLSHLKTVNEPVYNQLIKIMRKLETHYQDMCDIEYTIEKGKLWMLQTRVGKRTAAAAFRIAVQLNEERLITKDQMLERVTGEQLTQLMFPQFDTDAVRVRLTRGMPASPGAAVGGVAFNNEQAEAAKNAGKSCILVRRETNPDDLAGMVAAEGVLTARGGKTSHAAVVARGMGKTCVCGAESLEIDAEAGTLNVEGKTFHEGDMIAIDGGTGEVFEGAVPVQDSPVTTYLESGLTAGLEACDNDADLQDLVRCVDRMMELADKRARLQVRANADNPQDAQLAVDFGAKGIGLCRTEHMFLGDRRPLVEHAILSEPGSADRKDALGQLGQRQQQDFVEMLQVMDGKPMTVRLIDPPLHEFLPDLTGLEVKVALQKAEGKVNPDDQRMLTAVRKMHEANPMLGLRGVRLGMWMPGLFEMQIHALVSAAAELKKQGRDPRPEIMVPLVGSITELGIIRDRAQAIIDEISQSAGVELDIPIGCMIELPRAAITAESMAKEADFFSFGTNDLTQTTWGFSRDDCEGVFFPKYIEEGVFGTSPFETIDTHGVGRLVKEGVGRGRSTKPELKMGVCGEHGGDPESIHFFHKTGLNYVSCSPFRVAVARLEAGRVVALENIEGSGEDATA